MDEVPAIIIRDNKPVDDIMRGIQTVLVIKMMPDVHRQPSVLYDIFVIIIGYMGKIILYVRIKQQPA